MFSVAKKISYQFYDDFCVILNHSDGNDYKLNKAGAEILKKIESGSCNFQTEELEFIDDMIDAGIISKTDEPISPDFCTEIQNNGIDSSVWEELVEYASGNIIPVSAVIELTYRCPVDCAHCYINRSEATLEDELSFKKITEFIDDFRELGGLYLVLTGGDPLLHRDFEKIFNYARENHIAVSVMCSGVQCNSDLLKRMAEKGSVSFQASIHGHNSMIHDRFTGIPGSFEKTVDSLRYMKKLGVFVQAAVSVNKLNIRFYDEIVSFLENEKMTFVFNYEMFAKRNGDTSPSKLNISENELRECLLKSGNPGKPRLFDKKPLDPPCNAARSIVSLNPAGIVFPCLELRIPVGDIKAERFSDIWRKSEILSGLREIKFKDLLDCPECELRNFCNRCSGGSIRQHLNIIDHSPLNCAYAKLLSGISQTNKLQ
jgi:radical SAM protein with 4Fe4S-binding SPASM domain